MDESDFIPLHSALKPKKYYYSVLKSNFSKPFPLALRFFLPPRQDITSLTYPDGFHQAQVVWLRETRQDGLSAPSLCCEESFRFAPCLESTIIYGEVAFDAARFRISSVLSKEKSVR